MTEVIANYELACPQCGHKEVFEIPTDACQWFHQCAACHELLKPKQGDCCVFCSYGSVPCPPIQLENAGQAMETNCCG